MSERCPVCGSAVDQKAEKGRPRLYDRPACRRRAYELRRARAEVALLSRAIDVLRASNGTHGEQTHTT